MKLNVLKGIAIASLALLATTSQATEILFAYVGTLYHADGENLVSKIDALDGFNVTEVNLYNQSLTDLSVFDQVWVYDLNETADNSVIQVSNYNIIANWYNSFDIDDIDLIADGRIISSADSWIDRPTNTNPELTYEDEWIQNYALQLDARNGGLVLGTDHNIFNNGINTINNLIGINEFYGFYYVAPLEAVVDEESPLYLDSLGTCSFDSTKKCINDNSSTGIAPTGLQANGQMLTPVAWHGSLSEAFDNTAVSSTIGSITFGTEEPVDVSEPSTIILLTLGLLGLGFSRRRLTQRQK